MASGQDLRQIYAIAPARFVISKSDLDHGRKQVEKVLQDRPGMGKRTTIPSSFSEWRKSDDAKTFLKYWGEAYDNWLASKKG